MLFDCRTFLCRQEHKHTKKYERESDYFCCWPSQTNERNIFSLVFTCGVNTKGAFSLSNPNFFLKWLIDFISFDELNGFLRKTRDKIFFYPRKWPKSIWNNCWNANKNDFSVCFGRSNSRKKSDDLLGHHRSSWCCRCDDLQFWKIKRKQKDV